MDKEIIIDTNYDVAYSGRGKAIFSLNSKASGAQGEQRTQQAIIKATGTSEIENWGDNNLFPQEVIDDVEKNIELSRALEDKALLAASLKLIVGTPSPDDAEKLVPLKGDDALKVKDFLRKTNFNAYKYECAKDLIYYYNAFPEIVLSKDRQNIVQIATRPAEQCRWSKQNPKSGYFDKVYINANWKTGAKPNDERTIVIDVLDPYYDPATSLRAKTGAVQYIYPLSLASPGRDKYQLAPWNAVRASGWVKLAEKIPGLKQALLDNITVISYHIEFSNEYWERKFKDWQSMPEEKRSKVKTSEIRAIEDVLQGYENAGKNVVTSFLTDKINHKDYPLVKITPIEKKVQDEIFLKDDERSSSKVLAAVGLHPALLGFSTATGQGQGGGSDIREAYNLNTIKDSIIHDMILAPLYLVRDYNGWNPEIEFKLQPQFMTTLDAGKEVTNPKTTK